MYLAMYTYKKCAFTIPLFGTIKRILTIFYFPKYPSIIAALRGMYKMHLA
ncbi:hypothetical protein QE450_003114 [Paenibacillus sp. SORGH_AS306]|nr:hypothetical protein [Paenibacillus sp. SORGH_AS_0306]MDR6112664.1 hypothetical protein [Paenibacillus sp. SORGH_AS_0338]